MTFSVTFDDHSRPVTNGRRCGDCTLCCKLVPVRELEKKAGQKCKHQSHAKGCTVYQKPGMPISCKLWSCRWLAQQDQTPDLSRPDRSHYVLDLMPDFITAVDNLNGTRHELEVVQIWVDPKYPDAHRDPALRAYLAKLGEKNIVGLVRYDEEVAITIIPPPMAGGEWIEHREGQTTGKVHEPEEILEAIGKIFPR